MENRKFILVLSCPDRVGIVAKVASFLAEQHANILELAQFGDETTGRLFMRCFFEFQQTIPSREAFEEKFKPIVRELSLEWSFYPFKEKLRSVILVSKEAHCLNDLLHRTRHSDFPIDVIRIFSNHASLQDMAAWYNVPFQHAPISPETKHVQEEKLAAFVQEEKIDLVILARYMQILSADFTKNLYGKAVNIHHSFLPSFKGAKPYHQAFERGVKLIGATAHFVSDQLDEGPIIDQEVIRVTHAHSPQDLMMLGKDIESFVLARAVKNIAERRVFLNGKKTVVLQ